MHWIETNSKQLSRQTGKRKNILNIKWVLFFYWFSWLQSKLLVGHHHQCQSHNWVLLWGHWTAKHPSSSLHISGLKAREVFVWQVNLADPNPLPVKSLPIFSNLRVPIDHINCWFHWQNPLLWPLISVLEALYQAMICHHCTACIHSYGSQPMLFY